MTSTWPRTCPTSRRPPKTRARLEAAAASLDDFRQNCSTEMRSTRPNADPRWRTSSSDGDAVAAAYEPEAAPAQLAAGSCDVGVAAAVESGSVAVVGDDDADDVRPTCGVSYTRVDFRPLGADPPRKACCCHRRCSRFAASDDADGVVDDCSGVDDALLHRSDDGGDVGTEADNCRCPPLPRPRRWSSAEAESEYAAEEAKFASATQSRWIFEAPVWPR